MYRLRLIVIICLIAGFIGGMGMTGMASARSIEGKYAVGVNIIPILPVADNDSAFGWVTLESSTGYGLSLTRGWGEKSAFEVSLDRSTHDVKVTDLKDPVAEVSMMVMTASLQYRGKPGSPRFSPFIGIGAGYSLNNGEISSQAKAGCPSCTFDIDNSFALHLHGGTDYFFNDHWALSIAGRFTYSKSSYSLTLKSGNTTLSETDDLDLHRIDIRGGVKYYF